MSALVVGWSQYKSTSYIPGTTFQKHILAEGDSWFHFGYTPAIGEARNLLDALKFNKSTVIANIARTGDTIKHIADLASNSDLKAALAYRKWDLILLSVGGNDLIDALTGDYSINGNKIEILNQSVSSTDFMDYVNTVNLAALLAHIEGYYKFVAAKRVTIGHGLNRETTIVAHSYDYITARKSPAKFFGMKLGPWAHRAFKDKKYNVPKSLWQEITDYIFKQLADRLHALQNSIPNLVVINTLDTLRRATPGSKGDSHDWANEIHPNAGGYTKLAKKKLSVPINALLDA